MGILDQNPQRGVILPQTAARSGMYYGYRDRWPGTNGTVAPTVDNLYGVPFDPPVTLTADRIALNVTVAAAAGKLLRLGIYSATPAGLPDALLADSGDLAADTAAPFIAISGTISVPLVAGQRYYLAYACNGTPTVTAIAATLDLFGNTAANDVTTRTHCARAFTFAALPAAWGTPTNFSSASVPNIQVRAV